LFKRFFSVCGAQFTVMREKLVAVEKLPPRRKMWNLECGMWNVEWTPHGLCEKKNPQLADG
jgi:hypothetical protein